MNDHSAEILERLDQIFKMLAIVATGDLRQRDRIALFSKVGLSPKQIAELLGTSSNTVRVELVSIRKNLGKKRSERK
jgi:DNA-binding CsgD family transcriptional regulator